MQAALVGDAEFFIEVFLIANVIASPSFFDISFGQRPDGNTFSRRAWCEALSSHRLGTDITEI